MNSSKAEIIAIHDGLIPMVDPLLITLKDQFPEHQIYHESNSNTGLKYVIENLHRKMIVLLDINFSRGEKSGIEVFKDIRQQSSLVFIIMITARNLNEIPSDDLISLINSDAFALENASNYPKIVSLVNEAIHKLDVRVDSVIEEWILKHPPEKRLQPLIKTKDGKTYSMNDVMESIRLRTSLGIEFEKNLIRLAVNIFSKQQNF